MLCFRMLILLRCLHIRFLDLHIFLMVKICLCSLIFQGTSTKYSPQRVGLQHIMNDEDVIQIIKK